MDHRERIVAVGLLSERELTIVGQALRRIYRLDESHDFQALLAAIDAADRACEASAAAPQMSAPQMSVPTR